MLTMYGPLYPIVGRALRLYFTVLLNEWDGPKYVLTNTDGIKGVLHP